MMFALPLHLLQRHPLTVTAHFARSLVLTYAFPAEVLAPLLPAGLQLDTHRDHGFVAIALVQTQGLRPAILPRCLGQPFFLAGYRIFTTFRRPNAGAPTTLRGLYILRSDTDRRLMALAGNLLTHYKYRVSSVDVASGQRTFSCRIRTRRHLADLEVTARLDAPPSLPAGTPFQSEHAARRYAGPLPWTFDHEPQTNSIIGIRATRQNWSPRLVPVTVRRLTFFDQPPFAGITPELAAAFYVHDIDYQWNPGIRYHLH